MTRVRPVDARVTRWRVARAVALGTAFVRVTLENGDPASFTPRGFDQWMRVFLPQDAGHPLALPDGVGDGWYARWLEMPEAVRPVARNYTVREARRAGSGWELDVDVVVHRSALTGEVEGEAAAWAAAARPGDEVGLLDQGLIFDPGLLAGPLVAVVDESGLPGLEGVLRDLPAGHEAVAIVETPDPCDRRELTAAPGTRIVWVHRAPGDVAGSAALAELAALPLHPDAYLYVAGETALTLAARDLGRAAGLAHERIDTCAYWRLGRVRAGRRTQRAVA